MTSYLGLHSIVAIIIIVMQVYYLYSYLNIRITNNYKYITVPWQELEVLFLFLRNLQTHRQGRLHQKLLSPHLRGQGKPALYAAKKT